LSSLNLDTSDAATLTACVARLAPELRSQLADALRAATSAEHDLAILTTIRTVLAANAPATPAHQRVPRDCRWLRRAVHRGTALIRGSRARRAPHAASEDTAVGVVFTTTEFDNGYFLSPYGTVLYTDGSTHEVDFADIDEYFTEEYGSRGTTFTLAVDLRTDTMEPDDYSQEPLHTRFGIEPPRHDMTTR
jgi:hypothetical protein